MRLEVAFRLARGDFLLDVDLRVEATGITAVFGPSGCGKSTLLRCLAGLEHAPGGFVRLGAAVWQDDRGGGRFVPPHRRRLGLIFQDGRLFSHLDVTGNLAFGHRRAASGNRRPGWNDVVEMLELGPLLHRRTHGLSGGERQRVALGRALLTGPEMLLMDEPLASLDEAGKRRILGFIRRLHDTLKLPMLHVSHDMGEIMRLADHLALMDAGRILGFGPVAEMATRLDLPPAHAPDAAALVEAVVVGREAAFHLTHLGFGDDGLFIHVPGMDLAIGERRRLRILARDVSLTLDPPTRTSILNLFPAKVVGIAAENPAQSMVKLDVGGVTVLARVTEKSRVGLGLHPGLKLFAQVKSVALERG